MAGRDKKSKNITNTNASRESPSISKQTASISPGSLAANGKSDATDSMNTNASGAESSPPKRHGAAGVLRSATGGRVLKKKLKSNTKINIVRGRNKTKANFKLNIIKTQNRQNMIEKTVARRGRPPNAAKKLIVKDDTPDKVADDDTGAPDEGGAKTRGRKRGTTNEPVEDQEKAKQNDSSETKTSVAKESDNKKTVVKNVPKKAMKRKQLIVTKKALTKKKLLLAKQTLKTDAKQLNPKVLKKTLTAKLKSATEKLEAKKDAKLDAEQTATKTAIEAVEDILVTEIKKEPEAAESPVPNSRSSSPRTGVTRRLRTSSDLLITKNILNDSSPSPSGTKSPYSTRSDRSKSPFPTKNEPAQKMLRNGKQRKLKNILLTETVEQEFKKRRRLLSDSKDNKSGAEIGTEGFEEGKKPKRLRSYSRDGSEISKCSDVTESDLSFCDNMSTDIIENKMESKEFSDVDKVEGPKETSTAKSVSKDDSVSPIAEAVATISEEIVPLPINNSMDNENNNTDDKNKTDALLVSEKLATSEIVDSINNALKNDKLSEKSLILDKMSQTFNESQQDKAKSIRRSARQRKSTVKAKEHEETILIEKDGDGEEMKLSSPKVIKTDTEETPDTKTDKRIDVDTSDTSKETGTTKITAKKFYGDSTQIETVAKKVFSNETEIPPELSLITNKPACPDLAKTDLGLPELTIEPITKLGDDKTDKSNKLNDTDAENITLRFDGDDDNDKPENREIGSEKSQSIGKLINKLRNFEEKFNIAEKPSIMVTNDVILMSKLNADLKLLKETPNASIEKSKEKENILSCFENNSAISIIKKDQSRKSFDIDLPNSVTLIKRTGSTSRKHSTSSNSDSVTMIDKALGKDVTLELRKSIDKLVSPVDIIPSVTKTAILSTSNNQAVSISLKPHTAVTVSKDAVLVPIAKENTELTITKEAPDKAIVVSKEIIAVKIISTPKVPPIIKETVAVIRDVSSAIPAAILTKVKTVKSTALVPVTQPIAGKVASLASITLPHVSMPPAVCPQTAKTPATSPPPAAVPLVESPEKQKQKESILRTLGLLTLKAADEAKQEKQKQKELLIKSNKSTIPKLLPGENYTGTLKTVIKINRNSLEKKKSRSPLKMTFQKSKGRGSKMVTDALSGDSESDENHYYTIHKEYAGSSSCGTGSADSQVSGGQRKTHYSNRFNNHDPAAQDPLSEIADDANSPGKEAAQNLVIPEKASSFGIHPGRLCQDQCFYCGGKFGLFDTPCHVAQIKSSDRQKKILDNEEKLTVDSCLCDACYRHVDRRANCPSYRKRAGPGAVAAPPPAPGAAANFCHANACRRHAPHALRRKWLVKMRKSIAKVVELDLDYPGLHTIPLCDVHYQAISHLMVCGLCRRGLSRNHVHYINQEYQTLNPLLKDQGIPVRFEEKPVVCKLCRYYCTLLLRPQASHQQNQRTFLKSYRRRLMLAHNLEVTEDSDTEYSEDLTGNLNKDHSESKDKKKDKNKNGKNKTKKSIDSNRSADENHSSNTEHAKGTWKNKNHDKTSTHSNKVHLEEDIESLISSNKIPVPGTKTGHIDESGQIHSEISDNSDLEAMMDFDMSVGGQDMQSELQHLLQRCNVPSSTILHRGNPANLTHKARNILKVHNATALNKASLHHKVIDKNAKRIQKLGQIIVNKPDFDHSTGSRDDYSLEAMGDKLMSKDLAGLTILRNIALNNECTIETIPTKNTSKGPVDLNSMKSKWLMTDSFSTVKKNLSALSRNLTGDQVKKRSHPSGTLQSDPVHRLETNPSISVRELFPGEEEMNLHCSIEFGNLKGVTPEGWEKCNTTIQYDNVTKKLWHELQKPYGNQSSFLRHLILLEKYFRNGDLVLSQNANCNATAYSESVQNRLRSYDNIPSTGDTMYPTVILGQPVLAKIPSLSLASHSLSPPPPLPPETILETVRRSDSGSLIDYRKQKSNSNTGKSLLKANQSALLEGFRAMKGALHSFRALDNLPPPSVNQAKIPKNVPISIAQINQSVDQTLIIGKLPKNLPISLAQLEKMSNQIHVPVTPRPPTPRPDMAKPASEFVRPPSLPPSIAFEPKTSTPKSDVAPGKMRAPSLPPELIAINPQSGTQRKSKIENVMKSLQMAKETSTPTRPVPASTALTPGFSPVAPALPSALPKPADTSPVVTADTPPKKTKSSTKQWRPTLIPITDESKARSARDVLYQTADGRRLPSLVQVMSGGKPYHITIQDYNRMCIMRREKLQQMQKSKTKSAGGSATSASQLSIEPIIDLPAVMTVATQPADPLSPGPVTSTEKPATAATNAKSDIVSADTNNGKQIESASDKKQTVIEVDPVEILKSVGLKDITIGPITTSYEIKPIKTTPATVTSQSILLSGSKSAVCIPSIVAQLGSCISVTTETTQVPIKSNLAALSAMSPDVVPITSQAIVMPKMPKSLTVIPQAASASLPSPATPAPPEP